MKELNKVVYEREVYLKVNDLVEVFEGVSLYKIKNAIKKQNLETRKLKGFGNSNFISEKQASMLVVDGKSRLFSTKIRTINEELKETILFNRIFGAEGSVGETMLQETIEKFEKIEDYIIEESINDIEVDNEDEDFNKQFEKENLAFRQVDISLRNTNVSERSECSISVIVDKDSNIICNTPYNNCFEVQDDILHINCTEEWTGDVYEDYVKHIPVEYGYDKTEIDVAKILKQIYIGIKDIKATDFGDLYDIENMEISELELLMLLNNKDTLITGVKY